MSISPLIFFVSFRLPRVARRAPSFLAFSLSLSLLLTYLCFLLFLCLAVSRCCLSLTAVRLFSPSPALRRVSSSNLLSRACFSLPPRRSTSSPRHLACRAPLCRSSFVFLVSFASLLPAGAAPSCICWIGSALVHCCLSCLSSLLPLSPSLFSCFSLLLCPPHRRAAPPPPPLRFLHRLVCLSARIAAYRW